MGADLDKSLSDEATFAGAAKRRPAAEVSIGDERTLGDNRSGQDTVIDDIEIVDLETRYRVEGTLGQGGMGAVLLATDMRLDRKVAIKRILGEAARNKMAVQRFLTEAQAIAALNHPNIVQIYDYGRAKDGPFLIMEYVDGGSLLDWCRGDALSLDQAISLACQLCDGLAKAHGQQIIHRDIKPANILLTKEGIPKLTDFGLAKAHASDHGQTVTGAVLGTPDFMPPEQRRDASLVDHRSDLWSLAATVYQMTTGRSPKIIRFDLLPPALTKVLGKALEDSKDLRYQTARDFRDALRASLRVATPTPALALGEGLCTSCGAQNDSSRKFCRGCGSSLQLPCLGCGAPMPLWEEICGNCGQNRLVLVAAAQEKTAAAQAKAEELLSDSQFDAALAVVASFRGAEHTLLPETTEWILDFERRVDQARLRQLTRASEALAEAAQHEAAHDYLSALFVLESVPATLRSVTLPNAAEPVARALQRLTALQSEVRSLDRRIREKLASKTVEGLLPEVQRLLELQPERADTRKIHAQLVDRQEKEAAARDTAVRTAKALIATHDYDAAVSSLRAFVGTFATAEVVALREQAEQCSAKALMLGKKIRQAVAEKRLDGLIVTVDEYLRLKPQDSIVLKLRHSLVSREEKLVVESARRLKDATALKRACRFRDAIGTLEAIPEIRRTPDATKLLDSCRLLSEEKLAAMYVLSNAASGDHANAVLKATRYARLLEQEVLTDESFAAALDEGRTIADRERRNAKIKRLLVITAMALTAIAAVVNAGSWLQQIFREWSLEQNLTQQRWEAALDIDPRNADALLGRAESRLQASPPDLAGAIADLSATTDRIATTHRQKAAWALAYAMRAAEHARQGMIEQAAQDIVSSLAMNLNQESVVKARTAASSALIDGAVRAANNKNLKLAKIACNAATAAGTAVPTVVAVWQKMAHRSIEDLDRDSLLAACKEIKALGIDKPEVANLWLRYGTQVAEQQPENRAEIRFSIDTADANGATSEQLAPLLASEHLIAAHSLLLSKRIPEAAKEAVEAAIIAPSKAAAALKVAPYDELIPAVKAGLRTRLEAATTQGKWTTVSRLIVAAATMDREAVTWFATVVSRRGGGITSVPSSVVGQLPTEAIVALPPIQNSLGMPLKLLPPGTFLMGDASGNPDEAPHRVTLTRPTYIGVHEVTNAEWNRVMATNPSQWTFNDLPVENVSWNDAVQFCNRLSLVPEEEAAHRVYRLPTEAEWEYACRAGSTKSFSCGDDGSQLSVHAWFADNANRQVQEIEKKKANAWGLHDMHGNVWEWCNDWYCEYAADSVAIIDPEGPASGTLKVFRGGGWANPPHMCRSAVRLRSEPEKSNRDLGFRLAFTFPDAD